MIMKWLKMVSRLPLVQQISKVIVQEEDENGSFNREGKS